MEDKVKKKSPIPPFAVDEISEDEAEDILDRLCM